ncbi:hypothetical protein GCM10010191_70470 [Actinomadura vinacea]|uniref:histidine kinase n=1 Tax=Actinomadura vinacea TaxID=115336 RepID=A0ABN3K1L6_9ACTN
MASAGDIPIIGSAVLTCGVLLACPRSRRAEGAGALAAVSLAVTAAYRGPAENGAALWWLAEFATSLLLLRVVARRAPARAALAAGTALTAAVIALPLRLTLHVVPPATTRGAVLGCLFCAMAAAAAAAAGAYPRYLDARRARAVEHARRLQRLDLARDLHDFVAHDVSGIVVQAQAAQVSGDPRVALAALRRIEDAGVRAMASMDRTVRVLHDDRDDHDPRYTLSDLPDLADRFAESTAAEVHLVVQADPPGEASATAYRVIVEALTNVRRHAAGAAAVEVAVTEVPGPAVRVTVTDDGPGGTSRAHRTPGEGGRGLAGLAERVEAGGGEFAAGPRGERGWRVSALLPLPARAGSRS